jgi:hypothetical protein
VEKKWPLCEKQTAQSCINSKNTLTLHFKISNTYRYFKLKCEKSDLQLIVWNDFQFLLSSLLVKCYIFEISEMTTTYTVSSI